MMAALLATFSRSWTYCRGFHRREMKLTSFETRVERVGARLKQYISHSPRAVVEMEFRKEEYNAERSETEAFSKLKTRLTLPRHGMSMYVEVGWGRR
jgi:hypothetical protein